MSRKIDTGFWDKFSTGEKGVVLVDTKLRKCEHGSEFILGYVFLLHGFFNGHALQE